MTWFALLKWEWFKLRGRRVTWLLFIALLAFSSIIVFIRFADYQFQKDRDVVDEILFVPGAPLADDVKISCTTFLAGDRPTSVPAPYTIEDVDFEATERECTKEVEGFTARLDRLVGEFTLPTAPANALRWTMLIAIPFLAFFTVLVVGSEYAWGTLRSILMKGTGRSRILAAKLVMILVATAVMWVAVTITIILTSLISTAIVSGVGHGEWTMGAFGEIVGDTAKAWFSAMPYVALAALLSIAFSRFASGLLAATGLSIGLFFFELFSMGRLIKLFDDVAAFSWFGTVAEFDLGWNTAAWMFGEGGQAIPGFALAGAIGGASYPSDLHAFLVLLTYLLILTGLAFWLFRKRDVVGSTG